MYRKIQQKDNDTTKAQRQIKFENETTGSAQ